MNRIKWETTVGNDKSYKAWLMYQAIEDKFIEKIRN